MRIDPSPAAGGPGASTRAEMPAETIASGAVPAVRGAAPGDWVELSHGVRHVQRIVADALREASTTPGIRQAKVERARRMVDSGQLGRDSQALASAIIDDLLDPP